jgi:hypothetical protein
VLGDVLYELHAAPLVVEEGPVVRVQVDVPLDAVVATRRRIGITTMLDSRRTLQAA